jgi:peroxiredoxin
MTRLLVPGEPAPWFHAAALDGNPRYAFDTVAGRWTLVLFAGTATHEGVAAALGLVAQQRALFDDGRACFFGISIDPTDVSERRIAQHLPGIRWLLDYDRAVSTLYGAVRSADEGLSYAPHWLLLDPMLRVHARAALVDGTTILAELHRLIELAPELPPAPVLVVPGILPPDLCRRLIDLHQRDGGQDSGFMREENGITVEKADHGHKRRTDYHIDDPQLIAVLKQRLALTLAPMVQRAFQFESNRIERFVVACYDAEHGGHFRAHRDNTTKGTAHRKFACTINLNAEEYDDGDLCFPEFGQRTYRAPTGGAVIFSCSLLHEARPVTRGRRYAFLPFLYDDAGARLRERNLAHVAPELRNYRSGLPAEEQDLPQASQRP